LWVCRVMRRETAFDQGHHAMLRDPQCGSAELRLFEGAGDRLRHDQRAVVVLLSRLDRRLLPWWYTDDSEYSVRDSSRVMASS